MVVMKVVMMVEKLA